MQIAGQGGQIPVGWSMLDNSKLASVCPAAGFGGEDYDFRFKCQAVVTAWNSGAMDSKRNRLLVWGGGHADHLGNELYSVNLASYKIERLTDPAVPLSRSGCPEMLSGNTPNSRHTYDGVTYLENVDKLFAVGGSLAWNGCFSGLTWTFDLATNTWENKNPSGTLPRKDPGLISVYDPNSGRVFVHDSWSLYAYDVQANRYDRLANDNATDYHLTGVIDPVRRKFVMVGAGRVYMYDIGPGSTYVRETLNTSGGASIVGANYPGLAFDPVSRKIIAWHGGSTAYALDLDTRVWTPISFAQGPGSAQQNGTYKRFSYSKQLDAFVLVNSMTENVYLLKLQR